MPQNALPSDWLDLLLDPYAVLGISVKADERQIFKRYHNLAKLLHPDNYLKNNHQSPELAQAIFTILINPAYEQLKQEKKRLETLAVLRTEARKLTQQTILASPITAAKTIIQKPVQEAELIYQQAIASQAVTQYNDLSKTYQITKQLCILNLVYLWQLKHQAQSKISPLDLNQTNLNNTVHNQATSPEVTEKAADLQKTEQVNGKVPPVNYAQRHYERALQYTKQQQWAIAVEELRDAIKLEPNNSDYHALLGVVHYQQKLLGMAKVYIRQALKFNPQQPLALKYAEKLNIQPGANASPPSVAKALGIARLLNRFIGLRH